MMIEQLAYSLGVIAGSIAMCMAVYMQMVSPKYFKPRVVLLFWVFGITLVLINIQVVVSSADGVLMTIQVVAYTLLIIVEAYVASMILQRKEDPVVKPIKQ